MKRQSNEFELVVDFAIGSKSHPDMLKRDLRYMQEKVQTYRAIHTEDIDEVVGGYFESVVTMLNALEYVIQGSDQFIPIRCKVNIVDHICASVRMFGYVVNRNFMVDANLAYSTQMPINIELMYTRNDTFGNPAGAFSVDIVPANTHGEDTEGNEIIPESFGTIGNASYEDIFSADGNAWARRTNFHYEVKGSSTERDMLCILANPNHALRYCENFPAPSVLAFMASEIFADIYTRYCTRQGLEEALRNKQGGNEQDVETEQEWDRGSEEEVPEEG